MLSEFICCKDEEFDQAMRIRREARKIAASIPGVESIAMEGEERNILTVIGEEIDPVRLVQLLQKKVCFAKIVSFGPNQTNPAPTPTPVPEPVPTPTPVPEPVPTPVPPIWRIVEIREPTSCFNF
ncbi:unnamed protein product [Fraxinus pennsylvanica]|uniref:HMA domain-containing protein n=1 Tax=Fraxinus pennsylvanica TaxID=56036 RepID=A0AAD1YRB7_9LAMI|nr:unnamed protein product [Fraxinus pennsylvanica]